MHMIAVCNVRAKLGVLNRSIWLCRNHTPHNERIDPGSIRIEIPDWWKANEERDPP